MSSPLVVVLLIAFFVLLLLFVWRQRERSLAMWKRNDGSAIEQQDSDPWTKPIRTNKPSEFEQVSHEEIED